MSASDEMCVGALVEVVESGDLVGLRGEITQVNGTSVVVCLKEPLGEMELDPSHIRVIGERYGNWEKVVSSSSSPGDFYWYNWESGESTWDEPDEVTAILHSPLQPQYYTPFYPTAQPMTKPAPHGASTQAPSPSFSNMSGASSRKRTFSTTEDREVSPNSSSSDPTSTATPTPANKEVELSLLKSRLMELERKKRRIESQRPKAETVVDMQMVRSAVDKQLVCGEGEKNANPYSGAHYYNQVFKKNAKASASFECRIFVPFLERSDGRHKKKKKKKMGEGGGGGNKKKPTARPVSHVAGCSLRQFGAGSGLGGGGSFRSHLHNGSSEENRSGGEEEENERKWGKEKKKRQREEEQRYCVGKGKRIFQRVRKTHLGTRLFFF